MHILGIILVLVAVGLGIGSFVNKKKVYLLRSVERRKAGDIVQMANEIKSELAAYGGGDSGFTDSGEYVGDIVCEQPLKSELGGHPCVYYKMTVCRRYEERYWDKQANEHKTRRGTETVSSNSRWAHFEVRDETGAIPVHADGAKYDGLIQTVDKFEPAGFMPRISFGGFSINLGSQFHDSGDRRTVGYEYKEHILPPDARVTVIGEVSDKMGQLAVRKGGEHGLTISTRSREEMVGSAKKLATGLMIGAIGCGVLGAILTVVGLVT